MKWRATALVFFTLTEPRDGKLLERQVWQSLAARSHTASLRQFEAVGTMWFAVVRVGGRTTTLQGAVPEVMGLVRGLGVDVGAKTDVVFRGPYPRGLARFVRRPITRSTVGGGDPGTGGPGTAGVREPRRPYPPGFPPMQASLDPPVG